MGRIKDKPWMTAELKKEFEDLWTLEGVESRKEEFEYRLDQARVMETMLWEHYVRGWVEGCRQALQHEPEAFTQALRRLAVELIKDGTCFELVAEMTGLSQKEVLALYPA